MGIARCISIAAGLALTACVSVSPELYDPGPRDDPVLGDCAWTGRYRFVIYTESDHIRGFFEPRDLEAYRRAIPKEFAMPARPLIRVSVIDFYGMESGPVYREVEVSLLALHDGRPGWFLLTMPVTDGDACGGGRTYLGTPKVVRAITLERHADRYVGTLFARGGRTVDMTLSLDVGDPGSAARDVLRFASPPPDITLLNGRVVRTGGLPGPIYGLERALPDVWAVRLGTARLELGGAQDDLLHRLGIGPPVAAYWARMRWRFSITPRYD